MVYFEFNLMIQAKIDREKDDFFTMWTKYQLTNIGIDRKLKVSLSFV